MLYYLQRGKGPHYVKGRNMDRYEVTEAIGRLYDENESLRRTVERLRALTRADGTKRLSRADEEAMTRGEDAIVDDFLGYYPEVRTNEVDDAKRPASFDKWKRTTGLYGKRTAPDWISSEDFYERFDAALKRRYDRELAEWNERNKGDEE